MLTWMIGAPIEIGRVSEVLPVAPRADVRAPLVMERLLPGLHDLQLREQVTEMVELARGFPPSWQRLVSAELNTVEAQLIYERFVGITLRDLSASLRAAGRVLPLDVLRAVIEQVCEGLSALPAGPRGVLLSDRSIGLSIDGHWRFAQGALNHWLVNLTTREHALELEDPTLSADTVFLMSPEGISGRPELPASHASRVALISWQLATGGFHPYRGGRQGMMPSITRYTRDETRVPLSVHPELTPGVSEVLVRGVSFSRNRFADLASLRAALDAAWPVPAASPARTFEVIASLTWPTLQKELQLLKREPLLPIRWDGVWTAARTPEEGIAVLEDQLLERLEPLERFPLRGQVEEPSEAQPPPVAEVYAPALPAPTAPRRAGLLQRILALFRR